MAFNIFELMGKIKIDNSEASEALQQTHEQAEQTSSGIGGAFQSIGGVVQSIGGKISDFGQSLMPLSGTVTAIGTALGATAMKTASWTDNIDKMSQKLGISRQAYQEWDYILSQNGASIDSMKMGMKTLTNTLDGVVQSGSTAGTAFERLGLSFDDLAGKSQEEVFETTITALQGVESETERAALANDLFGRSGQELAPLLNAGAGSVEELKNKAHELGLVMDDDVIDAGVEMTDAMDTMKRALITVGAAIATAVMPVITSFADTVSNAIPGIREKVQSMADAWNNLPGPVRKVITVIGAIVAVAGPVILVIGKVIGIIGGIIGAIGTVISALGTVGSAIGAVVAVLTTPIGVMVAIGVAIGAVIAWLIHAWNTNEQFRNSVIQVWNSIVAAVSGAINSVITFFRNLYTSILTIFQNITTSITNAWTAVLNFITSIVNSIVAFVKTGFNNLKTAISTIFNGIKAAITSVWNGIKTSVTTIVNNIKNTVTKTFNGLASSVRSIFNNVKNAITQPIQSAKATVTNLINGIKNFMSGTQFSVPHIKIPHISVDGGELPWGIGGMGRKPNVSISWYAKAMDDGMMLNKPTIFGMSPTGTLLGAGEAGSETIVGTQSLMDMISQASNAGNRDIIVVLSSILSRLSYDNIKKVMVDALTDGSFRVMLNDREVGRIVRTYA